jgi:hypothetical protein
LIPFSVRPGASRDPAARPSAGTHVAPIHPIARPTRLLTRRSLPLATWFVLQHGSRRAVAKRSSRKLITTADACSLSAPTDGGSSVGTLEAEIIRDGQARRREPRHT